MDVEGRRRQGPSPEKIPMDAHGSQKWDMKIWVSWDVLIKTQRLCQLAFKKDDSNLS